MVLLVVLFRNPLSWETIITVFSQSHRNSSSQVSAGTSRWLVGSSSSSKSGFMNRAWARAILIRHPPLNSLVGRCWSAGENPRPARIVPARVSASSLSNSSKRSYTSINPTPATLCSWPVPSSSISSKVFSTIRSHSRSLSASTTAAKHPVSSPAISCSTCKQWIKSGIGTRPSLEEMDVSRVDLPTPFLPIRPYFCPWVRLSTALYRSSCLPAVIMISSTLTF
mmetsp:Transcript_48189/g.104857  ORF Transcript_48189/g.104857 Transcript_48189/m.104857 type:complete len:224 (+) Transcript_48189:1117-1788(+)